MYVYILYPRCKVAKLVILCMALPITTILVAGEWLNSLIFHDDMKCIAATCNGQIIIKIGTDYTLYVSHDNH